MTVAADIQGDYLHDGVSVAVAHGNNAAAYGYPAALSYRELMLSGPAGTQSTDQVWVLWAGTLTAAPVQGDSITSTDGAWTVNSVDVAEKDRIGATIIKYRCVCAKQR